MTRTQSSVDSRQITDIVHGFMQVWNKFESTLDKELAHIRDNLDGMHPHRVGQSDANYELFYRASSSIYPQGSMTMGEFSAALSVPLSTSTRIADWLVENGYLQRFNNPEDRRVVRIALTDNGRVLYKAIDQYVKQRLQDILSCLDDEEMESFLSLVRKIVVRLKEAAP
jgi:DNA-binding MarR family transcriptional regulator